MKWSEEAKKLLVISLALLASLAIFDKLQPTTTLTGHAVYETRQLQWAFDSAADYGYNSSMVEITSGEAKLLQQKITRESRNDTKLTLKQEENGKYKKKLEFESAAYSYQGTPKKLYFEADTPAETSIKLKVRTATTQSGLDNAEWQPSGKGYTGSGQNITGVQNGFLQYEAVLESDDKKLTPTLKSVRIAYETDEYPEEAAIQTKEASFEKTVQLLALATEEELNGQGIKYEYSTDSGSTWQAAASGQAISKNAAKAILRATLTSNKTHTPVLKDAKLSYKLSVCEEKWQANYTACGKNDSKTKHYYDANSCGSTEDLPADNGTTESCDHCTPQWTNASSGCRKDDTIESSYTYSNTCCQETKFSSDCNIPKNTTAACDFCTPNWIETNSTCGKDDKITATYSDANSCHEATGLQSDNNKPANKTHNCDYCTPSFTCASYGECGEDNKKMCTQANDSNGCHAKTGLSPDAYNGNYNEFAASCAYDKEAPAVNSASAAISGSILSVTANVTDKSPTTVTARLIKEGSAALNLTLQNISADTYRGTANATGLKGAYIITITAKDKHNNTQRTKSMAGVAAEAEKAAVRELALNSSKNAVLKLTNATRMEIRGKTEANTIGNIVLSEHRDDIKNTSKPKPKKELRRYIEIEADDAVKANITIATITINYTNEDAISANISEATIALYSYNETAALWEQLNSTTNTELNYVEGNTTHLSLFGLFGNAQNQTTNTSTNQTTNQTTPGNATNSTSAPAANSTTEQQSAAEATATNQSGESGGRAAANMTIQKEAEPDAGTAKTEKADEPACSYGIKVELEAKPSFINQSKVNATITNTGTCKLTNIKIKAAPPLDSYITIENSQTATLEPSESSKFAIIPKPAGTDAKGQPTIQGFAVKEPRRITSRTGKMIITGRSVKSIEIEEGGPIVEEEIALNIEVYEAEHPGATSTLKTTLIGMLAAIAALATLWAGKLKKGRRKNDRAGNLSEEKEAENPPQTNQEENVEDTGKFEENVKKFEEKHMHATGQAAAATPGEANHAEQDQEAPKPNEQQ